MRDAVSGIGGVCRLGVLSDTHGRLDDDTLARLDGVDAILHAGDIGTPDVLTRLEAVAPVYAVRGNVDVSPWALELPTQRRVAACGRRILLGHIRDDLLRDPAGAAGVDVVVFGHSHKPHEEWRDGVLWLNPGAAGPRRFHLPRAMAELTIDPRGIHPEVIILQPGTR